MFFHFIFHACSCCLHRLFGRSFCLEFSLFWNRLLGRRTPDENNGLSARIFSEHFIFELDIFVIYCPLKILFLDWDNILTEAQVLRIILSDFTDLVTFILPIGNKRDSLPIFDKFL